MWYWTMGDENLFNASPMQVAVFALLIEEASKA